MMKFVSGYGKDLMNNRYEGHTGCSIPGLAQRTGCPRGSPIQAAQYRQPNTGSPIQAQAAQYRQPNTGSPIQAAHVSAKHSLQHERLALPLAPIA